MQGDILVNYQFQFDAVFAAWPLLLKGTWITIQLSLRNIEITKYLVLWAGRQP